MRKIVILVLLAGFLTACASMPVSGSANFEGVTMAIESITFCRNLECTGHGDQKKCEFLAPRNDEFSQKVLAVFQERFLGRLRRSAIEIVDISTPAPRVKISLAYILKPAGGCTLLGESRTLQIQMMVFRGTEETPLFVKNVAITNVVFSRPLEKGELGETQRHARALAGRLATDLIVHLRRAGK